MSMENAGLVPVRCAVRGPLPGRNRGNNSANGAAAKASFGADKEHLAVGDGVHLLQQHVQEISNIPRVHVVEQRRRGKCRILQPLTDGVPLLRQRAFPFLRGDHVAGTECCVPDLVALR